MMSPAGASSGVTRRISAPACGHRSRIRRATVLGLVETDLAEVVEQRRGLERLELVTREAELAPGRHRERRDTLRVALTHDAAELGCRAERADRLVVRGADDVELLVRVPRREQRDREDRRSPETHAAGTVDAPIADCHEHRARDQGEVGAAAVHRDADVTLAHHPSDLGDDDRRDGRSREGEQLTGAAGGLPDPATRPRGTRRPRRDLRRVARRRAPAVLRSTSARDARGSSPGARRAARASRPSPNARSASTTMNANEIGSGTRSGGRSSISSPAAIAPPMSASAAHFVPASASWVPNATSALPPSSTATWMNRFTLELLDPRRGRPDRPSRCPPRVARPRTRAHLPRDRRRTRRRGVRSPR